MGLSREHRKSSAIIATDVKTHLLPKAAAGIAARFFRFFLHTAGCFPLLPQSAVVACVGASGLRPPADTAVFPLFG
ncbi:MAG: heme-binding protein [Burkholderiales bacterium]|nr:heme-binding protein [Burkholderiales bacterium]